MQSIVHPAVPAKARRSVPAHDRTPQSHVPTSNTGNGAMALIFRPSIPVGFADPCLDSLIADLARIHKIYELEIEASFSPLQRGIRWQRTASGARIVSHPGHMESAGWPLEEGQHPKLVVNFGLPVWGRRFQMSLPDVPHIYFDWARHCSPWQIPAPYQRRYAQTAAVWVDTSIAGGLPSPESDNIQIQMPLFTTLKTAAAGDQPARHEPSGPVVDYFGPVDQTLDWGMIRTVTAFYPEVQFRFVGMAPPKFNAQNQFASIPNASWIPLGSDVAVSRMMCESNVMWWPIRRDRLAPASPAPVLGAAMRRGTPLIVPAVDAWPYAEAMSLVHQAGPAYLDWISAIELAFSSEAKELKAARQILAARMQSRWFAAYFWAELRERLPGVFAFS